MTRAPRWAGQAWVGPFLALALVWGSSFAFVEVALRSLTPVQVAAGRLLLGAVTLLVLSGATRTRLPRGARTWAHLAVVGLLLNAAPVALFAYGQLAVSSVLAGIINAATGSPTCGTTGWSPSLVRAPRAR